MLTQQEYVWAWVFYLLGAMLFMTVCWYLTNKIKWREPKYLIRIFFGVFLLVPWYTKDNDSYLSPAWIISGIEGAFEGPEAFWRAGTPLLIATVSALVLSSAIMVFMWWYQSRQQKES